MEVAVKLVLPKRTDTFKTVTCDVGLLPGGSTAIQSVTAMDSICLSVCLSVCLSLSLCD